MSQEKLELTLVFRHDTGAAYGVTETDDEGEKIVYLPKSRCDAEREDMREGRAYKFMIPEWLAEAKGLI